MDTIKVLRVEPCKEPSVVEIEHTLESLQKEVGGDIQAVYPFEEKVAIVCNDEGKCIGLPPNRCMRNEEGEIYDVLCGNFLVVGLANYDFASLSERLLQKFMEYYHEPEVFIQTNSGMQVFKLSVLQEALRREGD